ncbi:hypothetical protein BDQ17DRAFT_1411965 [Cyathus striatus]|nr:hypothetical protein BDQ17DRAFT_1411965 [Cyathus striatus]
MYSQLAALSALALFAQSAFATDCARTYTVVEGDWCDTISAAKNVSTYQLAVVNSDINTDCTNLIPNKSICLGNTGEDCSTTYVVKAGDQCSQIISNHGLNNTIFEHNNPQINDACDNIYIGEVLCVSNTVQVPPLPSGTLPASTIPEGATPANPVASSSAVAASTPAASSAALVASTPASVAVTSAAPATTVASTTAAPASSSAAADDDDEDCDDEDEDDTGSDEADDGECEEDGDDEDGDDEDLPFCDEI